MTIEKELSKYFDSSIQYKSLKSRDVEVIKSYYGFNNSRRLTIDEIAAEIVIGNRERVRHLLKSRFWDLVTIDDLPSLKKIVDIINSKEVETLTDLKKQIMSLNLVSNKVQIDGIFDLIKDLGISIENTALRNHFKR